MKYDHAVCSIRPSGFSYKHIWQDTTGVEMLFESKEFVLEMLTFASEGGWEMVATIGETATVGSFYFKKPRG